MDIHKYQKRYESALRRVKECEISDRNKELIVSFHNALVIEGLSKPRLLKYLETLRKIARLLSKDLDKATIEDIKNLIAGVQQNEEYSIWTKQSYKIIVRRFYRWLAGTKHYPEIVDWIKINIPRSQMRLPAEGDLLTPTEAEKLVGIASHPRDKALVSMLWESGARISEIGTLRIKNVHFDEYGAVIAVRGKTGSRIIRLVKSTFYLSTWLNCHPEQDNPESPVWINIGNTNRGKAMEYPIIRKLLRQLGEKAGIKKRINPHSFRHSRATHMANHLTEFQMNQHFGWIQGSNMPAIYVHMSGKNVDEAILAMHGIKTTNHKNTQENSLNCPRCNNVNSGGAKSCVKCGNFLDLTTAALHEQQKDSETITRSFSDQIMNILMKDKDVQKIIQEKVRELSVANL